MGDDDAAAIAESIKLNRCLLHFSLIYNMTGDAGAAPIAESLQQNTGLQLLDPSYNRMGDS
jgi:hypothetical protein